LLEDKFNNGYSKGWNEGWNDGWNDYKITEYQEDLNDLKTPNSARNFEQSNKSIPNGTTSEIEIKLFE
jgi:hypothetical protein